jgi:hypothetical protein
MLSGIRVSILILLLLTQYLSASAQRLPGSFLGGRGGGGEGAALQNSPVVRDTSEIYFFNFTNINHLIPFSDSLLETFHQYDPIRLYDIDYAHLGNLGSAALSLFFRPNFRRGFDAGFHQFDLYQLRNEEIRFYKITQAFTQASFSQGTTQNDLMLQVKFSRTFAKGVNLSLESRQVNNLGAYDFQKSKNSNVGAGLWLKNQSDWYNAFITFSSNAITQENNGGIAEILNDTIIPAYQIAVNLQNSTTRFANREIAYTHYFNFNRWKNRPPKPKKVKEKMQADSVIISAPFAGQENAIFTTDSNQIATPSMQSPNDSIKFKRNLTFYHQLSFRTESFKTYDSKPDSAFYGDFLVDGRGLRSYLKTSRIENSFKLLTFKLRKSEAETKEGDLLEAGLVHSLHIYEQEPLSRKSKNDLFLTGKFKFSPSERIHFDSYGHLGIGASAGDFRISGLLFLDFGNLGSLNLEALNQLYSPSIIHERFFVSTKEIWKKDFNKTLETSLAGTYSLPQISLSATGQYHLINNLTYFAKDAKPEQSGTFSIFQLIFRKRFNLGPVYLENWVGLQKSTSEVIRLPEFYSKHSLYFQRKIFRKIMLAKAGLDARLNTEYNAQSYQPLIGQFYLRDDAKLPFTPLVDVFLSFQVKTFRFFYKIENLATFLTKDYYKQLAGYPLPFGFNNGGSRFGITWRLVD